MGVPSMLGVTSVGGVQLGVFYLLILMLAIGYAHLVKRRLILAGSAHDLPFP